MQEQIAIQTLLNEKMADARARNPAYSLRAFAKKVGMSPSALSEILKGKRKVSPKLFQKISVSLSLRPEEIDKVRTLFQESLAGKFSPSTVASPLLKQVQLSADQYSLIAEWHHFAILSLLEIKSTQHETSWIARKLGIPKNVADSALSRLERLGYLARKKTKWVLCTDYLTTTDEVVNLPLRRATSHDLHLAQDALEQVALELRDFTSVTMAADVQKLREAKLMIREFRDRLATFMNSGEKSEVYKMCIQLFPLSKGDVK
jgi:uncharacterized protein (TIGR02147 family)